MHDARRSGTTCPVSLVWRLAADKGSQLTR